jgi:3-phenylpropionate/trans-cinnamate dioxygenase ferredoxin subunit
VNLKFSELIDGKATKIEVNGKAVCVARLGDEVLAVSDTCTHSDASLSEGDISNGRIECWLHGAEFDLRTGAAMTPPATEALELFQVTRNGDEVIISEAANQSKQGDK